MYIFGCKPAVNILFICSHLSVLSNADSYNMVVIFSYFLLINQIPYRDEEVFNSYPKVLLKYFEIFEPK